MVPPASHRVSRVPWYSGYCQLIRVFAYWTFTVFGLLSQNNSTNTYQYLTQSATPDWFPTPVWALPRSLAATWGISVDSFSSGYLDVSVHRVPFLSDDRTSPAGFPHSDICGSMVTCTLPQLFAAYRVLLRLIWPRHPPYALTCLTYVARYGLSAALTLV